MKKGLFINLVFGYFLSFERYFEAQEHQNRTQLEKIPLGFDSQSFWTDWTADAVAGFKGNFNGLDWDLSMQYNRTDYDDYDCCYLQKPEFTAVSVGIKEDGEFNGWTSPFEPEAVDYYTASPTETATREINTLIVINSFKNI